MDEVNPTGSSPQDEASSPPVPASPDTPVARSKRKWLLGGLVSVFILSGAVYGAYWGLYGRFEQSTDDAYVGGNLVIVMPRVSGTVIAIRADNTELVKQGQPLVLLDSTDARIALDRAQARLAQSVRQVQKLYQTEAEEAAKVSLQQATLSQSIIDYRRNSNLVAHKAVSVEAFQRSGTQVDTDRASLELARHQLAATQAAVAGTSLSNHPQVMLAEANLRDAYVALQRTTIRAPVTGYVDKRSVQIGERVSPGKPLMAIVPLDQIWVDANFKESQLRNVRAGQNVTLISDLYGSQVLFRGRVLGLGAGTGSAFSVLPPQNATGNWIKVVQRVPVRIGLDVEQVARHPLRIGLSMEATVDTHNSDADGSRQEDQEPRNVYVTNVSQDEDKGAGALIARIIQENTVTLLSDGLMPSAAAKTAPAERPRFPNYNNTTAGATLTAGRRSLDGERQ
jgi:membrane fusion protein (multidrug efflux system)